MTISGNTLCSVIQSFPVLLILAQNNNKCLKTPLIYTPPSPTHSPEYYAAYDALVQSLFAHNCDHSYPHYGDTSYGYGKKWAQDYTYYKPCNGGTEHSHPGTGAVQPHGHGYPYGSSVTYTHNGYPYYGSKKANLYNATYIYKNVPNQITNTKHKYKIVVLKNSGHGRGRKRSEKLQRFFPQREMRRQYGFGQNFFPNPRRITQNLAGILHFRPRNQDRNQQYMYSFNNIPGISNNWPIYEQDYSNERPDNVRFPDRGRDIPNDNVNFEPPYQPYQEIPTAPNPEFNNNNGGLVPGNNDKDSFNNVNDVFNNGNTGLMSGHNNDRPVFNNNDNGGLISGNNNGQPVFNNNNNGGFIPGNTENGGLISGNTNSGGLISGNNEEKIPVFGVIEDGGAISSYDDVKQEPPTPVMVVEQPEDGNIPVFGDRNSEIQESSAGDSTSSLPSLTPVPTTNPKNNLNFGGQPIFNEVCETIDGNPGSCISILTCQPYVKLLQQSQSNPEAVRVLRGAHCGFEGNNPKVCCPRQEIPNVPPPSPQPTSPAQPEPTASPKTAGGFLSSFPEPPGCGYSTASFSRVVGGVNATLGDFPWMALLGYKSKRDGTTRWLCGGSLISSRHILTAAHCIHNHEEDLYLVRLGELDLARDDEGATPIDVLIKTKLKHEDYDSKAYTNDIGILVLEKDVQFTDLIQPICIPKEPELRARNFVDYNPLIAGWGDTEFRGPTATLLQVLQLPVVSNEACAQAYYQYKTQVIDQRVICAGYKNGGRDACQGDSGGPLMQPIWNSETFKTFFYQIGVVSYGRRCAEAGFPGVYTRVTEFVPWIQKNMLGSA